MDDEIVSEGCEAGPCVLVHGGAGDVPDDRRGEHAAGCLEAARRGHAVLREGGSALDAVQAAARVLEDLAQFNAGTGAALNEHGEIEHDASIMSGADRRAGAVCALSGFKNPIDVARAALDDGRHVLYAGAGARELAKLRGIAPVDPSSLVTDPARARLDAVLRARARGDAVKDGWAGGTIGTVALDRHGCSAAATSTGGIVGKRRGRVGDSPIVGAGTYAEDGAGAISATGDGEAVLRYVLAYRIGAALREGARAEDAARSHIAGLLKELGGRGGVIVVDRAGRVGLARSTRTMSFAYVSDRTEKSGT